MKIGDLDFLQLPIEQRRYLVIKYLTTVAKHTIKNMNSADFDDLCIQLFASDEIGAAWSNEIPMTPDLYDSILHLLRSMESDQLVAKFKREHPCPKKEMLKENN